MGQKRRNEKVSGLKTGGCNGKREKGNLSQESGRNATLRMGDSGLCAFKSPVEREIENKGVKDDR